MEACFLSSNSFTQTTTQLVPSIKARRNSNQFHCKRLGFPSSITCCHLSQSNDEDSQQPYLNSDWRSFRARLVANKQTSEPSTTENHNTEEADHYSPQITIGDKWAHSIHEPEKGCLLIATEKLDGVHIFERTVVLLLSMGPVGPFGIILNRPSLMSIKEMRSPIIDSSGMFANRPLYFGGPLEEGLFLVSPKGGYDIERVGKSGVFEEVMPGLYYGTKESAGCAGEMIKRNVVGVGDFRFYDGYCGWEKEQLREEICAGYWKLAASSASVIGLDSSTRLSLWEEVLHLMSPRKVW